MAGDPEDLDLDPPVPEDTEDTDLQDQALVESEADDESEPDQVDGEERQVAGDRPAEQHPQPSRGERRFQTLSNELARERQEKAELNRRLDTLLANAAQPRPVQETPEAREQRLALLTPEERIRTEMREDRMSFANEMRIVRFQAADGSDKAAFQAKATVDPLYKKWSDKVEAELAVLRNQNINIERERLMYYLIGKAAVEGRQANSGKQRAEAQQRVARQRTRPGNSGSDVSARRDRSQSLERRLQDVEL